MNRRRRVWSWVTIVALMLALFAPATGASAWASTPACHPPAAVGCHDGCGPGTLASDCQMICAGALPAPEPPAIAAPVGYRITYAEAVQRLRGLTLEPEPPPPR